MYFIRTKTKDGNALNTNIDRIESFVASDTGSKITMSSGAAFDVEESPRVINGLIAKSLATDAIA